MSEFTTNFVMIAVIKTRGCNRGTSRPVFLKLLRVIYLFIHGKKNHLQTCRPTQVA